MAATVAAIARMQHRDGCIPWFPGGQADPWNMAEAAMALIVSGRRREAEAALAWLARRQRPDGAWPAYTRDGVVVDPTLDSNFTAYIAAAVWLHHAVYRDLDYTAEMWPVVDRALGFALGLQTPGGEVFWARDGEGRAWPEALLTGSACIHLSLGCGLSLARPMGVSREGWTRARRTLGAAVRAGGARFLERDRWAMDWYYPVLGGAVRGAAARARIAARWDQFVVPGRGVRCVADRPWVTAAETCELVLTLVAIGETGRGAELLGWAHHLRGDDATYWTGANFTDGAIFPEEQPSWTAAAVVLAADAVAGGPVAELFAVVGNISL